MTPLFAVDLLQRALSMVLTIAGPLLLVALVVGLIVSLLQAVTQVQEQSLTFIPKLVAVGVVFLIALPWMMQMMVQFAVETFRTLPMVAR